MKSNQVKKLFSFIIDHHNIPSNYWHLCYKRFTQSAKTPYERLRFTFLDAINAAGGSVPLEAIFSSITELEKRTKSCFGLEGFNKANFEDFITKLTEMSISEMDSIAKIDKTIDVLSNKFNPHKTGIKKVFPQIREKKAAMFLILYSKDEIFKLSTINKYERYLRVPVDIVIQAIFEEKILKRKYMNRKEAFHKINKWAEDNQGILDGKPYLLDDLWFWGRFSRSNDNTYERYNEAKFKADPILTPRDEVDVKEGVRQFLLLVNS